MGRTWIPKQRKRTSDDDEEKMKKKQRMTFEEMDAPAEWPQKLPDASLSVESQKGLTDAMKALEFLLEKRAAASLGDDDDDESDDDDDESEDDDDRWRSEMPSHTDAEALRDCIAALSCRVQDYMELLSNAVEDAKKKADALRIREKAAEAAMSDLNKCYNSMWKSKSIDTALRYFDKAVDSMGAAVDTGVEEAAA